MRTPAYCAGRIMYIVFALNEGSTQHEFEKMQIFLPPTSSEIAIVFALSRITLPTHEKNQFSRSYVAHACLLACCVRLRE